jgi:hypothetical protein
LVWTSSLDGTLGAERSLAVTKLTASEHLITLRATDSDAMIGTAAIRLYIHTRPRIYLPIVFKQGVTT